MFQTKGIHLIGIVNVSPDSFSDGREKTPAETLAQVRGLIQDGATLIDIGAESTRPDAQSISVEQELQRLEPVVCELVKEDVLISIDTYKKEVAERMLELGADIINDVSGLLYDQQKIEAIQMKKAGIIIMHNRLNTDGLPHATKRPQPYTDVVNEVITELKQQVAIAQAFGLTDAQIAIDPGFGFAKTAADNIALFHGLHQIKQAFCNHAIVLGTSNKSFIGQITGSPVDQRLVGTLATNMYGMHQGCQYFRVHDVRAHADFFRVYQTIGGE